MSSERDSPEQQAMDVEMRLVLDRAIDALPEDFRLVFVLREVEQMSGAEAADVLGVPEQTIKTRLFGARQRLRETVLGTIDTSVDSAYEFHLKRCDRVVNAVLIMNPPCAIDEYASMRTMFVWRSAEGCRRSSKRGEHPEHRLPRVLRRRRTRSR